MFVLGVADRLSSFTAASCYQTGTLHVPRPFGLIFNTLTGHRYNGWMERVRAGWLFGATDLSDLLRNHGGRVQMQRWRNGIRGVGVVLH